MFADFKNRYFLFFLISIIITGLYIKSILLGYTTKYVAFSMAFELSRSWNKMAKIKNFSFVLCCYYVVKLF